MRTGERIGRWTLLEPRRVPRKDNPGHTRAAWLARCDCGTEKVGYNFKTSNSCGCLRDELARAARLTHGNSRRRDGSDATHEYTTWATMIRRCHAVTSSGYNKYGARGIRVCDEWRGPGGFERFLAAMGRRPSPTHSIGRIDNDGPYEPNNCRWETRAEQARNKRNTRWVTAFGRTLTLSEWSRERGVDIRLLHKRLKRMPPEDALRKPEVTP